MTKFLGSFGEFFHNLASFFYPQYRKFLLLEKIPNFLVINYAFNSICEKYGDRLIRNQLFPIAPKPRPGKKTGVLSQNKIG